MIYREAQQYYVMACELMLITGKLSFGIAELNERLTNLKIDDWPEAQIQWAEGLSIEDKSFLDGWADEVSPLERAREALKTMEVDSMDASLTDSERMGMMATRIFQMERIIRFFEGKSE